jgi:hypothetical protein
MCRRGNSWSAGLNVSTTHLSLSAKALRSECIRTRSGDALIQLGV